MNARGLRRYIDDLLRGRRPKPFRPDDFEAAQIRTAIDLQASRLGSDAPRQEFLTDLRRRLAAQQDGVAQPTPKSGATRRNVIVGTSAAAAAAVAAVSIDRALIDSAQVADRGSGELTPNTGRWMWVNVLDYGADPTGTADSTTAFTNAIAALPSTGGWVYAPSGTYKISSTLTFLVNECLRGDGQVITTLNYTGTGPCILVSNPADVTAGPNPFVGFEDFTIEGTSAGTGAIGLQVGDLFNVSVQNIAVQYFDTTGAVGIYAYHGSDPGLSGWHGWERWNFTSVNVHYCTTAVLFNGSNGGYSVFDFYIIANYDQCGITVENGCTLWGSSLKLRGTFAAGSTNTGWVLALDPGNTSGKSNWQDGDFDIMVQTSGNLQSHQTIVMGSSANIISGAGVVEFLAAGGGVTPFRGASMARGSVFAMSGHIDDPVLGLMNTGDAAAFHGGTQWSVYGSNTSHPAATIYPRLGDVQEFLLLSGNTTITGFSNAPYRRARKLELLLHQPASGAAGTITWPSNVKWAGGNFALSTANGYTDKVRLTYYPSQGNWYGEVFLNYA